MQIKYTHILYIGADADVFFKFLLATSTVSMKPHITGVTMDTCYSCKSNVMFESNSVNQTLWNVLIQAFVSNGSKSDRSKYSCSVTSHSSCNISLLLTLTVCSLCFLLTQSPLVLPMYPQPPLPRPLMHPVPPLQLLSQMLLPLPLLPPPRPLPSPHPPLGTTPSRIMKQSVC